MQMTKEKYFSSLIGFLPAVWKMRVFKSIKNIIYHISIFVLSAAIAFSLPYTGKFIADNYLTYWALIESEVPFLIFVEIAVAVLLIIFFKFLGKSYIDRKFSKMARTDMGLILVAHAENLFERNKLKKLKQEQGIARDVLMIGSTGFGTFVNSEGDLHKVIQNCREAKIMLLNPTGEGASFCAKSIPDPAVTPENFAEDIVKSIDFLKGLKALQRNIRLKLYDKTPFFKLTILGDYLFMKYFNGGSDEQPEYIFKHSQNHSSFFHPLYQYFLSKWRDPNIPEYDLDTDELVYRDSSGNETRRENWICNHLRKENLSN